MTYVFARLISKPAQDKETGFCKQGGMLNNSQMASEVAPDPRRSFQLMLATPNTAEAKRCFCLEHADIRAAPANIFFF